MSQEDGNMIKITYSIDSTNNFEKSAQIRDIKNYNYNNNKYCFINKSNMSKANNYIKYQKYNSNLNANTLFTINNNQLIDNSYFRKNNNLNDIIIVKKLNNLNSRLNNISNKLKEVKHENKLILPT